MAAILSSMFFIFSSTSASSGFADLAKLISAECVELCSLPRLRRALLSALWLSLLSVAFGWGPLRLEALDSGMFFSSSLPRWVSLASLWLAVTAPSFVSLLTRLADGILDATDLDLEVSGQGVDLVASNPDRDLGLHSWPLFDPLTSWPIRDLLLVLFATSIVIGVGVVLWSRDDDVILRPWTWLKSVDLDNSLVTQAILFKIEVMTSHQSDVQRWLTVSWFDKKKFPQPPFSSYVSQVDLLRKCIPLVRWPIHIIIYVHCTLLEKEATPSTWILMCPNGISNLSKGLGCILMFLKYYAKCISIFCCIGLMMTSV